MPPVPLRVTHALTVRICITHQKAGGEVREEWGCQRSVLSSGYPVYPWVRKRFVFYIFLHSYPPRPVFLRTYIYLLPISSPDLHPQQKRNRSGSQNHSATSSAPHGETHRLSCTCPIFLSLAKPMKTRRGFPIASTDQDTVTTGITNSLLFLAMLYKCHAIIAQPLPPSSSLFSSCTTAIWDKTPS